MLKMQKLKVVYSHHCRSVWRRRHPQYPPRVPQQLRRLLHGGVAPQGHGVVGAAVAGGQLAALRGPQETGNLTGINDG